MRVDRSEILTSLDKRYSKLWRDNSTIETRSRLASDIIARLYDDFYQTHVRIPKQAKQAFETCNWQRSVELSKLRISAFGDYRDIALQWFQRHVGQGDDHEGLWEAIYRYHLQKIAGIYQGDIAYAFLSSIRRGLTRNRWRVIDYSYARATGARRPAQNERPDVLGKFEGPITASTIDALLEIPKLEGEFRDRVVDCAKVASRINQRLDTHSVSHCQIIAIDSGFFRNRGGYIVGCLHNGDEQTPFALALLNERGGIYVDAVIFGADSLHYIFSSSLANFHSTNPNFHEVVDALFALMPKRPRGLHYATIGYNHVGKLAVLRQIERRLENEDGCLDYAPGPRGSVAIGFTANNLAYVLKVVRDQPTDQYKWEKFPGVDAVLEKYRQVHEINRAGSMLDNVIYENVALPANAFMPALRDELLSAGGSNIAHQDDQLVFRHLIVQMKMTPLPQFLEEAEHEQALEAISSLGRCIKNNAAANIFNRDLDGRNYGVGPTRKVYLFDYDAVEALTDIKVRTNAERFEGEEDVPDWFFEDGIVFLPEEIELHLRLKDRMWRQAFRTEHGDLLATDFWLNRQTELQADLVPRVTTYPDSYRLISEA